ncbi:MAG: protein kinase [Gemmataceae bacterium]|nr:protein kinase [Gemmataceae bacterium]
MSDPASTVAQPIEPKPTATAAYVPLESASDLVRVLDQYLADLQAGKAVDRVELLAAHPELAAQLEQCLAGIEFVHQAARAGAETPTQLGDFRIVREIGRGGMGVVYEAEQVSLKRRVALKVLRFGAAPDAEAMQRFQREAETVARLHHTNIVPVFAIGCEQGVHYYAMQFIEGRSLQEVQKEATRHGGTLDPAEAARCGLQAAEALAYAHQRGVIHRDIKPSNLLLDDEKVLWLSDFGLAKRADEVTMTATGMLLGTPRYMSPEQATTLQKPLDHRTDIYSLGATLYELATGRPVFDAETAQAVISQILHTEPVPPRRIQASLPRDLETIILKCLAKEPDQRYSTAQALADDLRAFREGRPIKARRPSVLERARRWVRKNRRSLALMIATATLAALVAVGAVFGASQHAESRLGQLALLTDGGYLKAEVLGADDQLAVPAFTVPTQEWLSLLEGDYRVRLSQPGLLSETVQLHIERGVRQQFKVELGNRQLWPTIELDRGDNFEFVDLAGPTDLVIVQRQRGVRRLATSQPNPVWSVSFERGPKGTFSFAEPFGFTGESAMAFESYDTRALALPPPDLNGDGVRDLVWGGSFGLIAQSGKDGRLLWYHGWRPELPRAVADAKVRPLYINGGHANGSSGRPLVFDVDGDGVPDLIAAVGSVGMEYVVEGTKPAKHVTAEPQRWLEAVSGKSGQTLWRRPLEARGGETDALHAPELVNVGERSIVLLHTGTRVSAFDPKTGAPLWPSRDLGPLPASPFEQAPTLTDIPVRPRPTQLLDLDGKGKPDVLLASNGSRLTAIDLASGQPSWPPRELGFEVVRPPQFLRINNAPALLLVRQTGKEALELIAVAWKNGKPLWTKTIRAVWPPRLRKYDWDVELPAPEWPLIYADGDGTMCIAIPCRPPRTTPEPPDDPDVIHIDFREQSSDWAGLEVLDSATGTVRWHRNLPAHNSSNFPQFDRFVVGPDINGDGRRDLFLASFGRPYRADPGSGSDTHQALYVTALSGADGKTLWLWRQPQRMGGTLEPLGWWQPGRDGHPLLMVACHAPDVAEQLYSPSATYFLTASTGRVENVLADIGQPRVADLNGDGIPDLYSLLRPRGGNAQRLHLFTLRSNPMEAWRRFGKWEPIQDLDRDGIPDLLWKDKFGKKTWAMSGRDGKLLWNTEGEVDLLSPPLPTGDLDGDGVPDLIRSSPLSPLAISGKTGRPLWSTRDQTIAQALKVESHVGMQHGSAFPDPRPYDLNGNGQSVIVYVYQLDFGSTRQSEREGNTTQLWMAAVAGRTGELQWKQPLTEAFKTARFALRIAGVFDLDGDGKPDLLLVVGGPKPALKAVRGTDGTLLWQRPLDQTVPSESWYDNRGTMIVVDPGVTGSPTLFVIDYVEPTDAKGPSSYRVQAIRARDGGIAWTWRGLEAPARPGAKEKGTANHWNARAVFANLKDIGPAVCLYTIEDGQGDNSGREATVRTVVLDGKGALRQQCEYATWPSFSQSITIGGVTASDVDGDGHDELLWVLRRAVKGGRGDDMLRVTRGGFDLKDLVWERPAARDDTVTQVVPARNDSPAIVLLYDANLKLAGVDGRTGKLFWPYVPGRPLIVTTPGAAPRYTVQMADSTACYVVPLPGQQRTHGEPVKLPPAEDDPRLARVLPWANGTLTAFTLASIPASLLFLVSPGWLLTMTVRRRSWRLGLMLLFNVGAIVLVYVMKWSLVPYSAGLSDLFTIIGMHIVLEPLLWPLKQIGIQPDIRWMRALLALPAVLYVVVFGLWLLRRHWWRVGALLAATLIVSGAAAAVMLLTAQAPFDPAQYYSWYDWPWIFGYGAYYTGALLMVGWLLWRLVRLFRRLVRRVRDRTRPALTAG